MALTHMQFSLDGYVFGSLADEVVLLESGMSQGQTEWRTQDTPQPAGDGLWFGRDYVTPPSWVFTLGVRADTDVMPVLARLAAVWRGDTVRGTPGRRSELRYNLNGHERVVYGRPRRFAVETDKVWQADWKIVNAEFQLADARAYTGTERALTLGLVNVTAETGLIFPTGFPWRFRANEVTRSGVVTVDSTVGSPFRLVIAGPASGTARDFKVWSAGWRFEFPTTLGPLGTVEVDTATGTATRNGAVFGAASARTDWRAELAPGPQEVQFTADDPSGTVTATIYWRDAEPI